MQPKDKYTTEFNNFVSTYIFAFIKWLIRLRFNYLIEVQIYLTF